MSFEGYYQVKCDNKHYYTEDCYMFSHSDPCKVCGAQTYARLVDTTNGDESEDESFSEGCDREIMVWKSQIDGMREDMSALIRAYRKYRYTREYSAEDQFVNEITKKYNLENTHVRNTRFPAGE